MKRLNKLNKYTAFELDHILLISSAFPSRDNTIELNNYSFLFYF